MKKIFLVVVMFGTLFGAIAEDKKTSGFLYSNYTSEHSAAPYVGSFVVKNNDSQQFYNGISAKLQSSLSSAFGSESLKNWFRHSLIKGEVSEYHIPDFMQIGGNYVSDFVTSKLTHNIEHLSYVHDVNIDIKTSLGDRKWEVALDSIGAVRDTDDDIILWNARGFVAQNDTGGGSAGLIYRRNFNQVLLGVNSYLDFENDGDYGSFWRYSSGIEAMGNSWDFSANVYRAITGDKTAIKSGVLSTAYSADGWDAQVNGNLPFYPQLAIGARYYKWQQKSDKNISGLVYSAELNPTNNFRVGVEYDDRQSTKGEWGVYAHYKILFGDKKESLSASSFVAQNIDVWERRYETPTRRYAQQIVKQATTDTTIQNGIEVEMDNIKFSPNAITLTINSEEINSLTPTSIMDVYSDIFSTVELEFLITTSLLNSITVGAILIIPESEKVQFGLFRVVESIREDNGRIYFATRQAGMTEIITGGIVRFSGTLQDEESQQTPSAQALAHIPNIQGLRTNQFNSESNMFSTYCGGTEIGGYYVASFPTENSKPEPIGACVGLSIDMRGSNINFSTRSMEIIANISARAAAGWSTSISGSGSPLLERIGLVKNRIRLFVGSIPIYIKPVLIVGGRVSTAINIGVTSSLDSKIGVGAYLSPSRELEIENLSTVPDPKFGIVLPDALLSLEIPDTILGLDIGPQIEVTPLIDPNLNKYLEGLERLGVNATFEGNVNANLLLKLQASYTSMPITISSTVQRCAELEFKTDLTPNIGAKLEFSQLFGGKGTLGGNINLALSTINLFSIARNIPEPCPPVTMGNASAGISVIVSWPVDFLDLGSIMLRTPCRNSPFIDNDDDIVEGNHRISSFSREILCRVHRATEVLNDGLPIRIAGVIGIGRGFDVFPGVVPPEGRSIAGIILDNALTGDYEVTLDCFAGCSPYHRPLGEEDPVPVNYTVEVIYGDQRRMFSGILRKDQSTSLIKFGFVNTSRIPYCYNFEHRDGREEIRCTDPPF